MAQQGKSDKKSQPAVSAIIVSSTNTVNSPVDSPTVGTPSVKTPPDSPSGDFNTREFRVDSDVLVISMADSEKRPKSPSLSSKKGSRQSTDRKNSMSKKERKNSISKKNRKESISKKNRKNSKSSRKNSKAGKTSTIDKDKDKESGHKVRHSVVVAFGDEISKEEKTLLHYIKIFGKLLIYIITGVCAAVSMMGISVSFVQIFDHFIGINLHGLDYVKENLTSIGVGLGSLGTCSAVFYKFHFMKLAQKGFYNDNTRYCVGGWLFISVVYLGLVFTCTWCLSQEFFIASGAIALAVVIGTPALAHRRYKKDEDKGGGDEEEEDDGVELDEEEITSSAWLDSLSIETIQHAFLDIVSVLIAAISASTACVIIFFSLIEIQTNILTLDKNFLPTSACRDDDRFESYFTNILTGCFLIAASVSRLAGNISAEGGSTFKYILYSLMALPCGYFVVVIAAS